MAEAVSRTGRRAVVEHPARRAYAEVLAVYMLAFGPSVVRAVLLLFHAYTRPVVHATLVGQLWNGADDPVASLACVLLAVALARLRGLTGDDLGLVIPARADLRERLKFGISGLVFFAVVAVCNTLPILWHSPGGETGAWSVLSNVPRSIVSGGMLEEVVLLGFLVAVLRQAGQSWARIGALTLTLRILFHLYYGPMAVPWVLVWAGAGLALYRWTGYLIPLVVAHATWDTVVTIRQLHGTAASTAQVLTVTPLAIVVGTMWVATVDYFRQRRRDGGASLTQPA